MSTGHSPNKHIEIIFCVFNKVIFFSHFSISHQNELSTHSNILLTSPEKILNVTYHLFENGTHLNVVCLTYNLMKMATLEVENSRRMAIKFCVQTVMTSNDSFKHLKSTDIHGGISRSLVLNVIVELEMGGQTVHSMDGNHS